MAWARDEVFVIGDLPEFFPAIPMVGSCHAGHRRDAHFQQLQSNFGTDEHQDLRKSPYGKRKSARITVISPRPKDGGWRDGLHVTNRRRQAQQGDNPSPVARGTGNNPLMKGLLQSHQSYSQANPFHR